MLHRLPRTLPPLSLMLADIGQPSPAELARALDVAPRTARRWMASDEAPRCAALALFWVTRWGISQVDAQAFNDAQHQAQRAEVYRAEAAALRVEIARLLRAGDFGCANDASQAGAWPLQLVRPA